MSEKVCPKCNNSIAGPEDKFCYKCGTEMVPLPQCECGKQLGKHDKFCPTCGKRAPSLKAGVAK